MEWRLFPLDVLFFRGTEPMNAGESGDRRAIFPPVPSVVYGCVRTTVLKALGVPFTAYRQAAGGGPAGAAAARAVELIGTPDGAPGELQITGPYLVIDRGPSVERWYPAPRSLLRDGDAWRAAAPDPTPVHTDLGAVRFVPPIAKGGPYPDWIRAEGLARFLRGEQIDDQQVAVTSRFVSEEPRTGLARGHTTRTAEERMLYTATFIRLHDIEAGGRVALAVTVDGLPEDIERQCGGIALLGGEGRMVEVEVHETSALPALANSSTRLQFTLLTPGRFGGRWLPPGFAPGDDGWHGTMGHIPLRLVSAVIGPPVRIGGWDIANHGPRPAEACVPAGSVYYCEAPSTPFPQGLQRLGAATAAGFGLALSGTW